MKTPSTLKPGLERLERAIAHEGLASRREAKDLIVRGLVYVNGTVVREPGHGIVVGTDTITIKGKTAADKEAVLLYKPRGIETTKTSVNSRDIHAAYPKLKHLAPIGRLDKDSEGLIILSNDGTLARVLTKPESTVGKTYLVTVRENVTDAALAKMTSGIMLDRVRTLPAMVKRASRHSFSIVLFEGRKHQIRRMCSTCHLTIESLVRTAIGTLVTGSMKAGTNKKLTPEDIEKLKR